MIQSPISSKQITYIIEFLGR